ncbi:MAG: Asp-tRNA(Asn)/Glu-tRNA(Gln) amidotransferase GatCAB subunit C [Gammaproteobacteria bacterium]|nr:MAG: Asp-tRNA(Asn)/Glu-tRNA(Gln) amidotransferase GatCAB subunit C [Gammaproteobacteria bacterium]
MAISEETIADIADLAKIRIDASQTHEVNERLNAILGMVEQLQAVDTTAVEPLANPLDAHQPLRADEVTETNRREAYQAIAPAVEDGLYLVPKVID